MSSQLLVCRRRWAGGAAVVVFAIMAAVAPAQTPGNALAQTPEAKPKPCVEGEMDSRPLTRGELDCLMTEAEKAANNAYGEEDKPERKYLPIFKIDLPLTDTQIQGHRQAEGAAEVRQTDNGRHVACVGREALATPTCVGQV